MPFSFSFFLFFSIPFFVFPLFFLSFSVFPLFLFRSYCPFVLSFSVCFLYRLLRFFFSVPCFPWWQILLFSYSASALHPTRAPCEPQVCVFPLKHVQDYTLYKYNIISYEVPYIFVGEFVVLFFFAFFSFCLWFLFLSNVSGLLACSCCGLWLSCPVPSHGTALLVHSVYSSTHVPAGSISVS